MKLDEIISVLNAELITHGVKMDSDIKEAFACDLLSWVVGHACPGCAFITIQTGINIVAVASLMEISCIIIVQNADIDKKVLDRALQENIPIVRTNLTTFEVCGILYKNGIKAVNKNEIVR